MSGRPGRRPGARCPAPGLTWSQGGRPTQKIACETTSGTPRVTHSEPLKSMIQNCGGAARGPAGAAAAHAAGSSRPAKGSDAMLQAKQRSLGSHQRVWVSRIILGGAKRKIRYDFACAPGSCDDAPRVLGDARLTSPNDPERFLLLRCPSSATRTASIRRVSDRRPARL